MYIYSIYFISMIHTQNTILSDLRKDLTAYSSPQTKESFWRFFKEPILCYGLKSSDTWMLAKKHRQQIKSFSKSEIWNLSESLWVSWYIEESFVACNWAEKMEKHYEPEDFGIFLHWIETYIHNRASCDTFCNHSMGNFLMKFPQFLPQLLQRTQSSNRRVKRAAAVSLIVPARKWLWLPEIFQIVDALRMDDDDMVQKWYGWLLKVASAQHLQEVFDYVMHYKTTMPRTALRYAIEKMPTTMKQVAMKK